MLSYLIGMYVRNDVGIGTPDSYTCAGSVVYCVCCLAPSGNGCPNSALHHEARPLYGHDLVDRWSPAHASCPTPSSSPHCRSVLWGHGQQHPGHISRDLHTDSESLSCKFGYI